jgi:tetratricopeptide (TPR) repeat protein
LVAEAKEIASSDLVKAKRLWKRAREYYQQSLELDPNNDSAAILLGNVLADEAKAVSLTDLPQAIELWRLAGKRYRQALDISPNDNSAAYFWGEALADEAEVVSVTDLCQASELWRLAGERYRKALDLNPDDSGAAFSWGLALESEAEAVSSLEPFEAMKLWHQAGERYRQAMGLDMHDAVGNLGYALMREACLLIKDDQNAAKLLFDSARKYLHDAEQLEPGSGAYDLACIAAMHGQADESVKWLQVCQEFDELPDIDHIQSDEGLDQIRQSPIFISWWHDVKEE